MRAFLYRITELWAVLGGILLLLIVLITTINVAGFVLNTVARFFGGYVSGLSGYEDAVSFAVGIAALSFMPYCHVKRGHIAVDVLSNLFTPSVQSFIQILSDLLIAMIALFLGYMMLLGSMQLRADAALSPVLEWSVWPFYLPGVFSCVLWAIVAVSEAIGEISKTESPG